MHYLQQWIWREPRNGLANWLLLILVVPFALLFTVANLHGSRPVYTEPLAFVWLGLTVIRFAEVFPRTHNRWAATLRIIGLICGMIAVGLLLWM